MKRMLFSDFEGIKIIKTNTFSKLNHLQKCNQYYWCPSNAHAFLLSEGCKQPVSVCNKLIPPQAVWSWLGTQSANAVVNRLPWQQLMTNKEAILCCLLPVWEARRSQARSHRSLISSEAIQCATLTTNISKPNSSTLAE